MKNFIIYLFAITVCFPAMSQNKQVENLPYYEIPAYPDTYTASTVAARMVDGLGFRYFWATEGLRSEDLVFKPSEEARTSGETIDHILGLTEVIVNSVKNIPNDGSFSSSDMTFEEKRARTLNNLKQASDILKRKDSNLDDFKIIFVRGGNKSEYPFWNQINGPIEDAVWHVGQIVTFRRSSGNPYNSKASLFTGKVRN